MTSQERGFQEFADFTAKLKGDEKSEAQTFLFHLLEAFNHDANTLPEGCTFEYRVRFPGDRTKFADLVWPGRVLIEMKSRGEKLSKHYQQTFDYWLNLVPHRPPYVVLCDFDEFWIYDFNTQLQEPLEKIKVGELRERHAALNFLYPQKFTPIFGNNWINVTRDAAKDVANVFNSLVARGESRENARRFVLQSVVAMFSEDIGLLPEDLFTKLLDESRKAENPTAASYDLIGGLFRQMNDPKPARGGRYAGVDYFNGGLFAKVEPVELQPGDIGLLFEAAKQKWQCVQPVIFGTLFEGSLGKEERHALGAHFTYEADIQKIVRPTIVRPWEERIVAAKNVAELLELLRQLRSFRVLDPACGSGNFLFVAYRALRELEQNLLVKLFMQDKRQFEKVGTASGISPRQFYGLDVNDNAVETAKVTLMLARRLAARSAHEFWDAHADVLPGGDTHALQFEKDLPLDNLDDNIRCSDALFTPWPEADAIIGNPPFLGSRYLAQEHGYEFARKVYAAFPEVPQMADFCVHWFRLAHDNLKPGCRAGLVGRNSIRHNESREASLEHIVNNGGTITEAVSSQVWPGDAVVHVSIVNWLKGKETGRKKLFTQLGDAKDSGWKCEEVEFINSSLSAKVDVSQAQTIKANQKPKKCFQGQNPVNDGFFLDPSEAMRLIKAQPESRDVLFPYMIGDDLVGVGGPTRWIIDFAQRDMTEAMRYSAAFERVKNEVMPDVLAKAESEKKATGKETTRWTRMANRWWQFRDYQPGLMTLIEKLPRYIACSRTTRRPIFEFVSSDIHPDTKLAVLAFDDDYSFGIIQSFIHWEWVLARCSTWKRDFNYTGNTVFDTFAWPPFASAARRDISVEPKSKKRSSPVGAAYSAPDGAKSKSTADNYKYAAPDGAALADAMEKIRAVAGAARALRTLRHEIMQDNGWSLRELYKSLETPGENRLRVAHAALDDAVRAAYGMKPDEDILAFLLKLNLELADKEAKGEAITPPGLPAFVKKPSEFICKDCITVAEPAARTGFAFPTMSADAFPRRRKFGRGTVLRVDDIASAFTLNPLAEPAAATSAEPFTRTDPPSQAPALPNLPAASIPDMPEQPSGSIAAAEPVDPAAANPQSQPSPPQQLDPTFAPSTTEAKPVYRVWYGTNRKPVDPADHSKGYSGKYDEATYYGACDVLVPKTHKFGEVKPDMIQRVRELLRGESSALELEQIIPFEMLGFWQSIKEILRKKVSDDRHVLVYLHGFNVSFEEAALRAAQISADLKVPGLMAFYSWPSKGKLIRSYRPDEKTIEGSEKQITDFLVKIATESNATKVHILAHSMGNRGLLGAWQTILEQAQIQAGIRYGQIILAAPDVDVRTFKHLAAAYTKISDRTTLYVSAKDKAVGLSGLLDQYPRAGYTPPITIVPGLDTVEVSNIDMTVLGHSYFAEAGAVLYDIFELLLKDLAPAKRPRLNPMKTPTGEKYWQIGS